LRCFDKPIVIQYRDEDAKQWVRYLVLHAQVNATSSNEYTTSGASRSGHHVTFKVRYSQDIKPIAHEMQKYRILYDGCFYRINGYDDFYLQHKQVKLLGETYG